MNKPALMLFSVLLCIGVGHADAAEREATFCRTDRQPVNAVDLVRSAPRIVLGLVTSSQPRKPPNEWTGTNVKFVIQVNDTIKGDDSLTPITIDGISESSSFPIDPYLLDVTYRHAQGMKTDPRRPQFGSTGLVRRERASGPDDCDYVPSLKIGMTYLIFLGPPTAVSFEPIVNFQDDPWCQWVKQEAFRQQYAK